MRPVAAPNDPIGSGVNDGARHGFQAFEVSVPGKAIRSGQLDPSASATDHIDETFEVGMRMPVALEHVAHVVDDEVSVEYGQKWQQIANHPSGGIELHVPADCLRAADGALDVGNDF